jgi:hypothetical protein
MGLSENGLIISDYTNTVAIPTDLNRPAAMQMSLRPSARWAWRDFTGAWGRYMEHMGKWWVNDGLSGGLMMVNDGLTMVNDGLSGGVSGGLYIYNI